MPKLAVHVGVSLFEGTSLFLFKGKPHVDYFCYGPQTVGNRAETGLGP